MKTKSNIQKLLKYGYQPNTIIELDNKQISVLIEKINLEKKERKESVTQLPTSVSYKIDPNEKNGPDILPGSPKGYSIKTDDKGKTIATQLESEMTENNVNSKIMTKGEVKEKFKSKSQQGLFWSKCGQCNNKNCKWCKMAKEFSDSTTKKEFENLPKKVKKTNENYQPELENELLKILENYINPKMTKKNIIKKILEKKYNNNSK